MSNKEKTKNKLMETMRMTKSDPGKKVEPVAVASEQIKAPQDDKPVVKEKKATAKKSVKETQTSSVGSYMAARRVWPD